MPDLPNAHAIAVMALTVLALYLFTRDRLPLEMTSLGLLVALAVGFALFPFQDFDPVVFYQGFGHQALIAVCALMVVGQGLVSTGALQPVGQWLSRFWAASPFMSFLATLLIGGVLSAFVNNTPIVVLLLPVMISVCLRNKQNPAGVLMPMGFATLVGGMVTTIGTSTNLLVVSLANDLGVAEFGMFDFARPALLAGVVAALYLWLIAPRLLPDREFQLADSSSRLFDARLRLDENSPATGKKLSEAIAIAGGDMKVVRIRRKNTILMPLPDVELRDGDRLRVQDSPSNLMAYADALKATMVSEDQEVISDTNPLRAAEDQSVAEIAVVQGSALDRTSLRYAQVLLRYQLTVLALHRAGEEIWRPREELHDVVLQPGDVLLVQGSSRRVAELKQDQQFLVLDATIEVPQTRRAPLALGVLLAVIATAAFGIMPIAISAVAGAAIMVVTGCLSLTNALRAVSPSVYFVVVASLALGQALVATGATDFVTHAFVLGTSGASPTVVMSLLMLLLAILTNVVSNNAAAVIGTPIAIGIAAELGLPAEPFVLAVLFGANMSYATPMAYQTNLLVMSAGNYRFSDFVRVGLPLTIVMWLTLTGLLSAMYF
ncbi:MAG: SLC13 family permease [Pseudomonadota bacterium]